MIRMSSQFAVLSILLVVVSPVRAAGFLGIGDGICGYVCSSTKSFFTLRESYKAREGLKIIDDLETCKPATGSKAATRKDLPKNALYQVQPTKDGSKDEQVIDIYASSAKEYIDGGLYKLCLTDKENIEYRRKRVGGVTTGLLVVPFKFRGSNKFSGDASIGPYFGFKREHFTLLASFGVTQVSMGTGTGTEVKSETGITGATGLIFSINESFDIAFVVGQDRVFGSAANDFEHQGSWWKSFAIGYNFTK